MDIYNNFRKILIINPKLKNKNDKELWNLINIISKKLKKKKLLFRRIFIYDY